MKKRIIALISLFVGVCVSSGLVACKTTNKSGEHEHTFSSQWSVKDAYSHWHAATCEHNDLGEDEELHDIGDDYRCAKCGYTLTPTEGLNHELNADGRSYSIVGVDRYVKDSDIVIPLHYDGLPVTAIAKGAFSGRTTLKSVMIPITVTSIGENAFYNCENLIEVTIPKYVTSVGASAFYGCFSLESVKFGDSIASIGKDAFSECSNLKTVNLTNLTGWCNVKLDNLGSSPFSNGADLYINGERIEDLIIPDSVTTLEQSVFYNISLTSLTLPTSVTEIRNNAFYGLTVDSVKYAGSVLNWLKIRFANNYANPLCAAASFYANNQKITELVISGIDSVGQFAFAGYKGLTSISLMDVKTIEANVFSDCVNLTNVTISNSVISIEDNAFSGCKLLKNVEVGNNIQSIGNNAFLDCKLISKIVLPDSVINIGDGAFKNCTNLVSLTIGEKLKSIGTAAFDGCYKLVELFNFSPLSISIGSENNGSVGLYALDIYTNAEDESKLTTTDDGYIFYDGLEETYLLSYVGDESRLVLPDEFNGQAYGIYAYTFCYLDELTEIVLPSSILSVGLSAFDNCKGLTYNEYQSGLYLAFGSNPYGIFIKVNDTAVTSVSINSGTRMIADCAFLGSNIDSISIPGSVVSIGERAFNGCANLKSVTFVSGLESIGARAFYGCTSLESLTLPDSIKSIGKSAFFNCSSLKKLIMPDTITSIGANAFDGCRIEIASLPASAIPSIPKSFLIAVTVTSGERLVEGAFDSSTKLTKISLPNTINYVGKNAFNNCSSLIYTEDEYGTYLGNSDNPYMIFIAAKNKSLTEYTLRNQTKIIYDKAFYAFTNLVTVNGECILSIGANAFYNCSSFTNINIADGATYIGDAAFYYCSKLSSITIPDSVVYIGPSAFRYCSQMKSITIPSSVTEILDNTFYGCSDLKNVTVHENINYIGNNVFTNTNLEYNYYDGAYYLGTEESKYLYLIVANDLATSCTLHDDVKFICLNAFFESNIKSTYIGTKSNPYLFLNKFDNDTRTNPTMTVNERTEYIGSYAFTNVSKIGGSTFDFSGIAPRVTTIPDSVKYIGSYAFRGNSYKDGGGNANLNTIYISGNVLRIDEGMIASCFYISHIYYDGTYEHWNSIIGGGINKLIDISTCQYSSLTIHCKDGNYKVK